MRSWVGQVIGSYPRDIFLRRDVVLVAVDALQKGIDFFLGEKIISHGCCITG
jgi:hypothetical protein